MDDRALLIFVGRFLPQEPVLREQLDALACCVALFRPQPQQSLRRIMLILLIPAVLWLCQIQLEIPFLALHLLLEELCGALVYSRKARIVNPLLLAHPLVLLLQACLIFLDLAVSLEQLEVQKVDLAAQTVPLIALSAGERLQTRAIDLPGQLFQE